MSKPMGPHVSSSGCEPNNTSHRILMPEQAESAISSEELARWINHRGSESAGARSPKETYLDLVLSAMPILFSAIDENDGVLFASSEHTLLEGVAEIAQEITTADGLFPPYALKQIYGIECQSDVAEPEIIELSLQHKNGDMRSYHIYRLKISTELEGVIYCTIGQDITEKQKAENSLRDHKSRLNYMAYHDALTGLANRSLFYDKANKRIGEAEMTGMNLAIVLIDLDRFKNVNDSLGHDAGDALLKLVADILAKETRGKDLIARIGGDEFALILDGVTKLDDVNETIEKLLEELSHPLRVHGHDLSITASVGVSLYPDDGRTVDKLLKHADLAMYQAKSLGKNRFELFQRTMQDATVSSLLLENDLRRAIEQQEMLLHYQPQICITTGRIIGLEALVRWKNKERGMVSPDRFIPLAEESGLIVPLGEWVLRQACMRFKAWLDMGLNFGMIAVNISAEQFRQREFEYMVKRVLQKTQLDPQYLELEITESSAMENAEQTILTLTNLKNLGLFLSIDDFGTGYSSLAYLKRFPIQKLKIDRAFVDGIDSGNGVIAKSIINLAHNMSLDVIAEGVEREEQSRWLLQNGCDQVQGFFYSRPLSERQLLHLIDRENAEIYDSHIRLLF